MRSARTKLFTLVWLLPLIAGIYLGVPGRYTHHTLYAPARALFIPAGIGMILHAAALWRWSVPKPKPALGLALAGFAVLGIGMHKVMAGPWTLLAVPACLAGLALNVRALARGPRDPWFNRLMLHAKGRSKRQRSERYRRRHARGVCLVTALLFLTGAIMAVASA